MMGYGREGLKHFMNWSTLSDRIFEGGVVSRQDALAVLKSDDDELLAVLDAAFRVRLAYCGREVRLHVLQNAKSGTCQENCAFCSQSIEVDSGVDRYRMQTVDELVAGARAAHERQAVKYCMVTATRGPSTRELETVCEAVRQIKRTIPIELCTSLGLLNEDEARQLFEAGVHRFNHNLETSRNYFPRVCQSHTYDDRLATVRAARAAGMEACCGGIIGMGETLEDRVDLAFELRDLEVEAIPVNFMDPRPGTPLADLERSSPADCLRALALFRFVNPTREIRIAGGREVNIGHLQPLALYPANSMFTEGYLTTPGQGNDEDMAMIRDAGFEVAAFTAA